MSEGVSVPLKCFHLGPQALCFLFCRLGLILLVLQVLHLFLRGGGKAGQMPFFTHIQKNKTAYYPNVLEKVEEALTLSLLLLHSLNKDNMFI